jgi:acyl-CoA synthetase (NDP forming)
VVKNSLKTMFRPKSVAILGASTNEEKSVGDRSAISNIMNLMVQSILNIEGEVDLALIVLPAALVIQGVRECAEKGVKSVVIFSAGFAETGNEGREAQLQMSHIAAQAGMRIVGPNCMGIAAFDHNMIITFGVSMLNMPPVLGPISIVSQSGAFGSVAYAESRQRQLGVRLWATTGNEADVNVADCLNYYVEDPETKVIMMYFEASRDGAKLVAGLKAVKKAQKLVIAMKVGSSDVGAEAALSHTNSLAGSDSVVDTVLTKYNAYRAPELIRGSQGSGCDHPALEG